MWHGLFGLEQACSCDALDLQNNAQADASQRWVDNIRASLYKPPRMGSSCMVQGIGCQVGHGHVRHYMLDI